MFKLNIKHKGKTNDVLIRLNGKSTEKLLDRKRELHNMKLAHKFGLGPKIFCSFDNGICYEYFEGRSLQPHEMSSDFFIPRIARKLAQYHAIRELDPVTDKSASCKSQEPMVFFFLQNWIRQVRENSGSFADPVKAARFKENFDLEKIESEIQEMKKWTEGKDLEIVFCHNDLLSGNMVHNPITDKMQFIDFEYSGPNFRAFDIANHFCEYTGFQVDPNKYPNRESQLMFLKDYMDERIKLGEIQSYTEEEMEKLFVEVNVLSLVAHLYWGVWALFQARFSAIDFDYLTYAKEKIDWHFSTKQLVCFFFLFFFNLRVN